MVSSKVNVLVYSGNGSTVESVRHCLYTLRRVLGSKYAVVPVTGDIILKEPWTSSCALLVFPGGADLGYCRTLNGEGNRRISQYVRRGGSFLGLCAGGYYGTSRCEFEVGQKRLEVVGSRELGFFPGTCRGCAFSGFVYHSEEGARAPELEVDKSTLTGGTIPDVFRSYYNGGGVFVDAGKFKDQGVEVLARYTEALDVDGGDGSAAVVYCKVGEGAAVLTGPHPEFAAVNLNEDADGPGFREVVRAISEDDDQRINFFKACLEKLGLVVNQEQNSVPSLSRLHLSSLQSSSVSSLLSSLKEVIVRDDDDEFIKGDNDVFHIRRMSSGWSMDSLARSLPGLKSENTDPDTEDGDRILDYDRIVKHVQVHEKEHPPCKETPYFNHHAFYANLSHYHTPSKDPLEFGKYIMYGEVVTSTNTMLEKNPQLLRNLPSGFTATATVQVAGRGRGSNVWVSPAGSLIFSTCIRHPHEAASNKSPVIFVQYIAAMAVVEAVKSYDPGYQNVPIKLKWPNDIYALDPTKPNEKSYVKIGGILVNSSFVGNEFLLVVGIGLNTTNPAPTTSLNALLPSHLAPFTLEKLLARILVSFEALYYRFVRKGFSTDLQAMYYSHWLHTDQIITIDPSTTTTRTATTATAASTAPTRACIKGITTDWGLLRAEELGWEDRPTGRMIELQSDSNSFDFLKGLIRRKV
ncbi:MAG: biotin holocarboxylase synthetase [Sclerophora amabilis]|nr:MAG: biotin holocarboxylase synthetase [Sclerophora amabilis]